MSSSAIPGANTFAGKRSPNCKPAELLPDTERWQQKHELEFFAARSPPGVRECASPSRRAVIEMPYSRRRQWQASEPSPIEETFQGKQGRLRVRLLDQPASHDATARLGPAGDAVFKFGDLPAWIEPLVTQAAKRTLERGGHPRHHGVLGGTYFQHF